MRDGRNNFKKALAGFFFAAVLFAPASFRLDERIEIFLSIIIGELCSRRDPLSGKDENPAVPDGDLAVRPAGMIDVSGGIGGNIPIDRLSCVDLEKISAPALFGFLFAEDAPRVFYDADPFRDLFFGKKPLARNGAAHRKLLPARGIF